MVYEEVMRELLPRRELDFPELEMERRMKDAADRMEEAVEKLRKSRRGDGEFRVERPDKEDFIVERRQ